MSTIRNEGGDNCLPSSFSVLLVQFPIVLLVLSVSLFPTGVSLFFSIALPTLLAQETVV